MAAAAAAQAHWHPACKSKHRSPNHYVNLIEMPLPSLAHAPQRPTAGRQAAVADAAQLRSHYCMCVGAIVEHHIAWFEAPPSHHAPAFCASELLHAPARLHYSAIVCGMKTKSMQGSWSAQGRPNCHRPSGGSSGTDARIM